MESGGHPRRSNGSKSQLARVSDQNNKFMAVQTFIMDHYPTSNSALIETLKLQKHPEGGYFVETDRQPANVPSPFAGELVEISQKPDLKRGADNEPRSLATAIYYLLTHEYPDGVFHTNKSFASRSRSRTARRLLTLVCTTDVPHAPPGPRRVHPHRTRSRWAAQD